MGGKMRRITHVIHEAQARARVQDNGHSFGGAGGCALPLRVFLIPSLGSVLLCPALP